MRNFTGKGRPGGKQEGEGTQEDRSALWFAVSGVMVMRLVSGCLWPIILTQGPFWWHAHHSGTMESSQKVSGRLVGQADWCLLSPFDLS